MPYLWLSYALWLTVIHPNFPIELTYAELTQLSWITLKAQL